MVFRKKESNYLRIFGGDVFMIFVHSSKEKNALSKH
jgi:hypothetical protein